GVFLLPYCFFAVLCGLPLFLLESVIGQYTQEGAVTCWKKLCPLSEGTGYFILVIQLYSRLYTIVLAWALLYIIYCFRDPLPWATCSSPWNTDRCVDLSSVNLTAGQSGNVTLNVTSGNLTTSSVTEFWERQVLSMSGGIEELGKVQWELLLCLLACWMSCYFCIWKGVRSTGKVVYFTAIFPYVMLVILLIRGLTLPGALQGVVYYLYPDVSRLADLQVWMDACSQVLFSYGVSSGTLITFGSYNKLNNNCCRDSLWLCLLNSCTSFVAGFTVFSVLGFMAQQQGVPISNVVDSGPGLAFFKISKEINQRVESLSYVSVFVLQLDPLLMCATCQFSGLETITAAVIDLFPRKMRRPWRREIFLVIFCSVFFLVQILLVTEGGVYLFQLIDHYAANGSCIMFGSVIHCVVVGWAFGADKICDAVEDITGHRPWAFYKLCWRYFTPLICTVCFICSLINYQSLISSKGYVYPDWAYSLGWAMAWSSIVTVPIYAIVKLCLTKGTLQQRLMVLWHPDDGNKHQKQH
uniref:Uncharacterized protein n=1 Tax=Tetraodon nigroviridis TaxID=99883 RepID=H3CF08_TETNG